MREQQLAPLQIEEIEVTKQELLTQEEEIAKEETIHEIVPADQRARAGTIANRRDRSNQTRTSYSRGRNSKQ